MVARGAGSTVFSPSGNEVAFVGTEDGRQGSGIYVSLIGGEKALRLTTNPGDGFPAWSPDGQQIAFSRFSPSGNTHTDYLVPALGGAERRLYTGNAKWPGLSWSPDGKAVAFSQNNGDQAQLHAWIAILSIPDSTTRPLTTPSAEAYDWSASFSPDGANVAFVRGKVAGALEDLFVVPVRGGEPRRLTYDNRLIVGITWTPDGRDIVFSSPRGGVSSLWRISATGGTPRAIPGVGAACCPAISPKGNQLAYEYGANRHGIWRIELKDETHVAGRPMAVTSGDGINYRPHFSPDSKRFTFESDRLGYSDIWTCDSNGSDCSQLTSLGNMAGTGRWSPDGHYIAFEFHPKGHSEISVVEFPGGQPRLVSTFPDADNGAPNWSRDGQWIYFYSKRGASLFELWKVPSQGGPPVQVTRNGGVYGVESADGRFLYYSKFEQSGIWRMPLNGGEETRILNQPEGWRWFDWAVVPKGIYFLDSSRETQTIKFLDFATRGTVSVLNLERPAPNYAGVAVSPDGGLLLYGQDNSEPDHIMLVKNYR